MAFDRLESDEQILKPDLWLRVLLNTRAGLMPAERKPRLSAAEQADARALDQVRRVRASIRRNPDPGRVTVRRLNRVEYRNTVRDLLGVDYNTDHEFPPDDSGFGFDNIGDALTISPMLMEKYVAAAQAVDRARPCPPRRASPPNRSSRAWPSRARMRGSSGASASSCSANRPTSRPTFHRRAAPAAIA